MAIPGFDERKFKAQARQLDRLYRDLENVYSKQQARVVFRESFQRHGQELIVDARGLTPVDRGAAARSIGIRFSRPRGERRSRGQGALYARFGMQSAARSGKRRVSKQQMLAIEFGNRNLTGRAPLRRTWDANIDQVLIKVGADLGRYIIEAARRAAGPLRRT